MLGRIPGVQDGIPLFSQTQAMDGSLRRLIPLGVQDTDRISRMQFKEIGGRGLVYSLSTG